MRFEYLKILAIGSLLLANGQLSLVKGQEHVVPFTYGDMDQWVVREIHESGIIGGNT